MRQEVQAIVLAAGPGSRMTKMPQHPTEKKDEKLAQKYRAKSLLPIGNYPMVYYPLKFLEKSGFTEVTVVINQKEESGFKKLSSDLFGLKIKLDFAKVDASFDPGTADSLRQIEGKIKKNVDEVLLVSGDLITDASLHDMLNFHRSRGAALTILTSDLNLEYAKAAAPGPKSKTNFSNDVICLEEGSSRLAYAISAGDYDERISLPSRVYDVIEGGVTMATDIQDAHLYIMKRWVLDYVLNKESACSGMGSLKAEVIPHLISEQFRKDSHNSSSQGFFSYVKEDRYDELIEMYNTSVVPSRFQSSSRADARACYAYHHQGALCVRVNTMGALWLCNKKVHELHALLNLKRFTEASSEESKLNEKAQICDQTLIGKHCEISEKTNISNSVIGDACKIRTRVRVSNSVLFDNVELGEGSVVENSWICVSVEPGCVVKNCIVTEASKLQTKGKYENELLEKDVSLKDD